MKKREGFIPDLTPLIDVVFILLIFFIVSSVFKKEERALSLSLPQNSSQLYHHQNKDIIIELTNNKLAFTGKIITLKHLEEKLLQIKDTKIKIILRIDKDTIYSKVLNILDILQKHDFNNISLLSQKKN